ncbi:MAG: L-glutamate gamma-semialdehyde dehydrogenase [Candidatus Sumerlaeota bacterium]|nr:L-glutamate gamma-semialdehyde dehydrogenase [Candidatus Sumerlaeota bacterium]
MSCEEFRPTPVLNFTAEENRNAMLAALEQVESELGREYAMVVGGKRVKAKDQFFSHNPARWDQIVGVFQKATADEALLALETALAAFEDWKRTPAKERADYCFRVADLLRRRRLEVNAWLILEVGKSWIEADADTAEAIDLVTFYGHEVLRYGGEQPLTRVPSERNELRYIPLGAGIVVPPWNFPVAILSGMTTAAFASGNTVVLKPSSDAPGCAKKFMEILEEAGLPPGVVNLVTGPGGEIGDALVGHPKTRFISFTGSKEVGLRINEIAARHQTGQLWIKRVIAEMGGKNAIVVDSEADLGAAVEGVLVSAFGYSGQKCSACSRAIVAADVHDEFVERLAERTKQLKVGPPKDPENFTGPVINLKAMAQILDYIEMGRREGQLLLGGGRLDSKGSYVEPTILIDIDRKATVAQAEIFGPVLSVIKAQDFNDALDIANDSEYGLTGSVYSANRQKLEWAAERFHVGNLYFNRKSTGALVGVHPFGGFNMSGTDSKAGGRDYLQLYTQAKCISEKIA